MVPVLLNWSRINRNIYWSQDSFVNKINEVDLAMSVASDAGSQLMRSFDTAIFDQGDRFDAAYAFFGDAFDIRQFQLPDRKFHSRNEFWRIGSCIAARAAQGSVYFSSKKDFVTSNYLVARLMRIGRFVAIKDGSINYIEPGRIAFGRYLGNFDGFANGDIEFCSLAAPIEEVGSEDLSDQGLQHVSISSPNGRVLCALMLSVFEELDGDGPMDPDLLSDTIISLFRLLQRGLQRSDEASRSQFVAARAKAMRRYIAANVADPALGPAQIAAAFGVSRAAVLRAFEGTGGVANTIVAN